VSAPDARIISEQQGSVIANVCHRDSIIEQEIINWSLPKRMTYDISGRRAWIALKCRSKVGVIGVRDLTDQKSGLPNIMGQ